MLLEGYSRTQKYVHEQQSQTHVYAIQNLRSVIKYGLHTLKSGKCFVRRKVV